MILPGDSSSSVQPGSSSTIAATSSQIAQSSSDMSLDEIRETIESADSEDPYVPSGPYDDCDEEYARTSASSGELCSCGRYNCLKDHSP